MFSNLQNPPTFHSEESWPTYKKEESALLVYLLYIIHLFTWPSYGGGGRRWDAHRPQSIARRLGVEGGQVGFFIGHQGVARILLEPLGCFLKGQSSEIFDLQFFS